MEDLEEVVPRQAQRFDSAEETLQAAVREPELLESLSSREFERLLVELFSERGYSVLTPQATKYVGTADFVMESRIHDSPILMEVKKQNRQSRVSVEAVRQLLSSVSAVGARLGLLITTSGYTAAAIDLATASSIVLRTLDEVLTAKSERELLKLENSGNLRHR